MNRSTLEYVCIAHVLSGMAAWGNPVPATTADETPFPPATPESQGLSSESLQELRDLVGRFVEEDRIVGAELLVIKNRRTVLHDVFGWNDREEHIPMARNTIFNIRSMTKPVTGTAGQILIDQGMLSLDDPVAEYLPSFDHKKSRDITIAHLMSHRSGLGYTMCMGQESLRAVADCCGGRGPEEFLPGTSFQYSNGGSDTIAAIVAEVSGTPFDEFVTRKILEPLGMDDSLPLNREGDPRMKRRASCYVMKNDRWTRSFKTGDRGQYEFMPGAHGLGCTPMDYARFLAMWLDGGVFAGRRVLSEQAVRRGLTPQALAAPSARFGSCRTYYGQQWLLYLEPAGDMPVAFGHSGSDGTHCWVWPGHDLMVLYFTQSSLNATGVQMEMAIDRLLIRAGEQDEPVLAEYAPYLGLYWSKEQAMYRRIGVRDGNLILEVPGHVMYRLSQTDDPDRWKIVDRPGDSTINFKRNAAGVVTAFAPPADTRESPHPKMEIDAGLPSVEQLMRTHTIAHGMGHLEKLGVFRMSGTFELETHRLKGTDTLITDGTRRAREEVKIPGVTEETSISNGDHAWMITGAGCQKLSGALREQIVLGRIGALLGDWREHYETVEVIKCTRYEGEEVYIVRTAPREAHPAAHLISVRTGLLLRTLCVTQIPGLGDMGGHVHYEDYRDVEGVRLPFCYRVHYDSPVLGKAKIQYDKIETELEVDETLFEGESGDLDG